MKLNKNEILNNIKNEILQSFHCDYNSFVTVQKKSYKDGNVFVITYHTLADETPRIWEYAEDEITDEIIISILNNIFKYVVNINVNWV